MLYRLIALNGPRKGERVTVPTEPLTIGREKGCGLCLDDPEAALCHAVIETRGEGVFVRDLGAMGCILVNKREVREAQIRHGDVLEIGRSLFLVQAVLQAEVNGLAVASARRRRKRATLRAAAWTVVAVAGAVLLGRMVEHGRTRGAKTAESSSGAAAEVVFLPVTMTNVVSVTNAVPAPEVSRELQRLRDELTLVKDAVRSSAWTAQVAYVSATHAATSTVAKASAGDARTPAVAEVKPAVLAADEARRKASESVLTRASEAARAGRAGEADRLLAELQTENPDFLPAYEARAALYERQGQLDKAIGQWSQLLQRSSATPLAGRAAEEWSRLTAEHRRKSAEQAHRIKIVAMTQMRFPESGDYDEMRVVRIELETIGAERPDPASVRVEVSFFDRDGSTGAVALTRAMTPRSVVRLPGPWPDDGPHAVTAAYVVPPGFRARSGGAAQQFHGYVVRVFADDVLQDEAARPTDLLRQTTSKAAPAAAAVAAGRGPR